MNISRRTFRRFSTTGVSGRTLSSRDHKKFCAAIAFWTCLLIMMFKAADVFASGLDIPLPNGGGIGVSIPLGDKEYVRSRTEIQLFVLMGRQKIARLETPTTGEYLRFSAGRMSFTRRMRSSTSKRTTVLSLSRHRHGAAARKSLGKRVRVSGRSRLVKTDTRVRDAVAVGSTHVSQTGAYESYVRSVSSYEALRKRYLTLRGKRSKSANSVYKRMMRAYQIARYYRRRLQSDQQ